MSEALENAVKMSVNDDVDSWKIVHNARYEAELRFLRRWPNAFEQHDGTFAHYEWTLGLLRTAEIARLDGVRAAETNPT